MKWKETPSAFGKAFRSGGLAVIVSLDQPGDRWHLSISHAHRYPTYEEIKEARYALIPDHVYMAQIFPPRGQFVNLHPNFFHLHEWRDNEILRGML
jgi:hypothetical protein